MEQQTISITDVIKLLRALGQADPNAATAVADMLDAALRGEELDINVRDLGIDQRLLVRVLESAGGNDGRPRVNRMAPSGRAST